MKHTVCTTIALCLFWGTGMCDAQDIDTNENTLSSSSTITDAQKEELVHRAQTFATTIENYVFSEEGKKSVTKRHELRDAFLQCDANTETILEALTAHHPEITRKVQEWALKQTKGMLQEKTQVLPLDQFLALVAEYETLYNKTKELPIHISYATAHHNFKETVLEHLKAGISADEIVILLQNANIENRRVLSQPHYLAKKNL